MSSYTSPAGAHCNASEKQPVSPNEAANGPYLAYNPNIHAQPDIAAQGPVAQTRAYSEVDHNPLPQIAFGNEMPEVFQQAPAVKPDAVRADFVNGTKPADERSQETNVESTKPKPRYHRKLLLITAAVSIVGILAVVFGTLRGLHVLDNNRSASAVSATTSSATTSSATTSPASHSSTTSPTSSTSTTATSASPTPSLTNMPPQCTTDKTGWLHNITFITPIDGMHTASLGWTQPAVSTQEDCCTFCYNKTPEGCDLWLWDPNYSSPTPCTIILGYEGSNPSQVCPSGHTNSSGFSIHANGRNTTFGPGPCGTGGIEYVQGQSRRRMGRWLTGLA